MSDINDFQKLLSPAFDLRSVSRQMTIPQLPDIPPNPLIVAAQANYASEFHKRLLKWVADFDASLDQAHEIGVRLVSFGQTVVFHLTDIGFWNPSLLSFKGVSDDGNPVELIQHVSPISILLTKLPRKDPSQPKRSIGFALEPEPDEGKINGIL